MLDGAPYAVCLTHDVDRPYKGLRSFYYALRERPGYHLGTALRRDNPYWQFEAIRELEDELGVRSAFFFLREPHLLDLEPTDWIRPINWIQHLGRYDPTDSPIAETIRRLDADGWEIGLHGSYHTMRDRERLAQEKAALERTVGHSIRGGRQHYLRLERPTTWQHYVDLGLDYDSSLGSGTTFGLQQGASPFEPFDDGFTVFPLTMMDQAVMSVGESIDEVWEACEPVLEEAADRGAVVTLDWHQRVFNDQEFPGYREVYRRLIEAAQAAGAWIGPPGTLYDELHPQPSATLT